MIDLFKKIKKEDNTNKEKSQEEELIEKKIKEKTSCLINSQNNEYNRDVLEKKIKEIFFDDDIFGRE